jgi:outer membrane protein assembly factor BamE
MRKIILLISIMALLAGCAGIHPYTVDVQQGNVLDQKALSELHLGMSKDEVQSLLGAPLLNDMFATSKWTYVYTNQINGGKIEKKKLNLEFDRKNKLDKIY